MLRLFIMTHSPVFLALISYELIFDVYMRFRFNKMESVPHKNQSTEFRVKKGGRTFNGSGLTLGTEIVLAGDI